MDMERSVEWAKRNFDAAYEQAAIEYARTLIRFEPVNPPGDEYEAAHYAAALLEEAGFSVEIEEFAPRRCNVLATYGNKENIGLILNGHLDVVAVSGEWTYPPFEGKIERGILHGRGSSDMLGGCAAIISAARCAAKNGLVGEFGILVLLVADEEDVNRGMQDIVKNHRLRAKAALIAEPTALQVHLGNRGFGSFFIRTAGRACHSSRPDDGENAIYKMGHVLIRLENFAKQIARENTNPYLGHSTMSVGVIHGGIMLNTVPDFCEIEVERRLLPGETQQMIHEDFQRAVGDEGTVVDRSFLAASLLEPEHPFCVALREVAAGILGEAPKVDVFTACTEACFFSVDCGIPTLIFGPGNINRAHRIDEYCELSDIAACGRIFAAMIHYYMGCGA